MERRLACRKSRIPWSKIRKLSEEYDFAANTTDLDPRIKELEANAITRKYEKYHVQELGRMERVRPGGVVRLAGIKLNSTSTQDSRDWKFLGLEDLIGDWGVRQIKEVG